MKREILSVHLNICGCCPGHDTWPDDVYANRRSVRARSRDIAREHRVVRRIKKQRLRVEVLEATRYPRWEEIVHDWNELILAYEEEDFKRWEDAYYNPRPFLNNLCIPLP